jgi:hypothetical protein
MFTGGSGEMNDGDWDDGDDDFDGIENGFGRIHHIHLQDNP